MASRPEGGIVNEYDNFMAPLSEPCGRNGAVFVYPPLRFF
jgi:hypothetical protein